MTEQLRAAEIPIIIADGGGFTVDHDAYMVCLSDTPDDALFKGMFEKFGYDWYYHIPDLETYIALLIDSDARLQHGGECQHVTYDAPEEFERDFSPCIFRKRPQFSWQHEIRILLYGETPLEPFNVTVPDLAHIVSIAPNPAAQ